MAASPRDYTIEPRQEANDHGSVAERLRDAAVSSALMAEAAEAVEAHFRPQYMACWEGGDGGRLGPMIHQDLAFKLYPYVIEKEREAKSWRADFALLTEGAETIDRLREALALAARTFRQYEAIHRAKATEDGFLKAEANADVARQCEAALGNDPRGEQVGRAPPSPPDAATAPGGLQPSNPEPQS